MEKDERGKNEIYIIYSNEPINEHLKPTYSKNPAENGEDKISDSVEKGRLMQAIRLGRTLRFIDDFRPPKTIIFLDTFEGTANLDDYPIKIRPDKSITINSRNPYANMMVYGYGYAGQTFSRN